VNERPVTLFLFAAEVVELIYAWWCRDLNAFVPSNTVVI
jgi:hypothetical protein